jgi:hypothetical protein
MILSVMHTPNGNLVELRVEDGVYTTTLYAPVEDSERELSVLEARDLQHTIRLTRACDLEGVTVMDVRP